jgi:MoaA/NifB/PqqE/SkfB family radical SAM enzyme
MLNGRIQPPESDCVQSEPLPLKVNLITNYSCNLRCTYCDVEHLNKSMLKTRELLKMLDVFVEMGMQQVNFIGGEPLLRADLGLLLSWAKKHRVTTVVHSNGNFVRPPDDEVLNNTDVFITCVNGTPSTHECSRGLGTYAPTISAIELMQKHGIAVVTDMILNVSNSRREDIDHVLRLAREYGFRVNFQQVFEHGLVAADSHLIAELQLDKGRLRNVFTYLLDCYDPKVMFNSRQYLLDVATVGVTQLDECFMGRYSLTVDPFGRIARCFKYVQESSNPNGQALGWKEAARRVRLTDCVTCPYSNHAEDNHFLAATFGKARMTVCNGSMS